MVYAGILKVYTDGSSLGNGTSSASAGWGVYWENNTHLNRSGPVYQGKPTNNRAELYALDTAFDQILGLSHKYDIIIYTDSQYCKNALGKWAVSWQANGWVNLKKNPVMNRDLIKGILAKINKAKRMGHGITIDHVQGHSGNRGNEEADRLARDAAGGDYVD